MKPKYRWRSSHGGLKTRATSSIREEASHIGMDARLTNLVLNKNRT